MRANVNTILNNWFLLEAFCYFYVSSHITQLPIIAYARFSLLLFYPCSCAAHILRVPPKPDVIMIIIQRRQFVCLPLIWSSSCVIVMNSVIALFASEQFDPNSCQHFDRMEFILRVFAFGTLSFTVFALECGNTNENGDHILHWNESLNVLDAECREL